MEGFSLLNVGAALGSSEPSELIDGDALGPEDGTREGLSELIDGELLGIELGESEGPMLGLNEGMSVVGELLGEPDGTFVGSELGFDEGSSVLTSGTIVLQLGPTT